MRVLGASHLKNVGMPEHANSEPEVLGCVYIQTEICTCLNVYMYTYTDVHSHMGYICICKYSCMCKTYICICI